MGKGISARECQRVWDVALEAGKNAGEERYAELQKNCPAWNVVDDREQVVGQILDLCGFERSSAGLDCWLEKPCTLWVRCRGLPFRFG